MSVAGDDKRSLPDARGKSSGAPKGNKNALKHGQYTAKAVRRRREFRALLREARALLSEVD